MSFQEPAPDASPQQRSSRLIALHMLTAPSFFTFAFALLLPIAYFCGGVWFPDNRLEVATFTAAPWLLAAAVVLNLSEPLAPLRDKSALWRRLSWFGAFLAASAVLTFGLVLGQTMSDMTANEALEFVPTIVAALFPLGIALLGSLLLLDLFRLPAPSRALLFLGQVEKDFPWLNGAGRKVLAAALSGGSHPALVVVSVIVIVAISAGTTR